MLVKMYTGSFRSGGGRGKVIENLVEVICVHAVFNAGHSSNMDKGNLILSQPIYTFSLDRTRIITAAYPTVQVVPAPSYLVHISSSHRHLPGPFQRLFVQPHANIRSYP